MAVRRRRNRPPPFPPSPPSRSIRTPCQSLSSGFRRRSRNPGIKLTENRNVYRVEVFGENPSITDILGPDFLKGPVPYSGMTHQEFLDMVTPKDVQGYAAFSNGQGMMVAATSNRSAVGGAEGAGPVQGRARRPREGSSDP